MIYLLVQVWMSSYYSRYNQLVTSSTKYFAKRRALLVYQKQVILRGMMHEYDALSSGVHHELRCTYSSFCFAYK